MVGKRETSGGLEWRVRRADGSSSDILVPEMGLVRRIWLAIVRLVFGLVGKVQRFFCKAWDIGVEDPRKIIHCVKVGLAVTAVSLFYYIRPLYEGVGGNAMWAVLTVVVVFEYTVGATLSKSINRTFGTLLAGALGVGVHWLASKAGENFEPIILRTAVFLLAAAATFSRFIPTVKARFDYGAMIFILTFSLVSVSGYRVEHLFKLAQDRLSTVAIGEALCLIISMVICPIWAGRDLHLLIARNLKKLAGSLDGCVAEYFKDSTDSPKLDEESRKKLLGYKCVLNTKASEEALAIFARWEPPHGRFSFRHPWKQYLKIGATLRNCAYCIEALNACINSETQAPEFIKKHLKNLCMELSSHSSDVLKELAEITLSMRKSSSIEFSIEEMKTAVQELLDALKSLPAQSLPPQILAVHTTGQKKTGAVTVPGTIALIEILPVVTATSLLIEIATRIEEVVAAVDELARLAYFKPVSDNKPKQSHQSSNKTSSGQGKGVAKTMEMV